jgi:hypothetical protein
LVQRFTFIVAEFAAFRMICIGERGSLDIPALLEQTTTVPEYDRIWVGKSSTSAVDLPVVDPSYWLTIAASTPRFSGFDRQFDGDRVVEMRASSHQRVDDDDIVFVRGVVLCEDVAESAVLAEGFAGCFGVLASSVEEFAEVFKAVVCGDDVDPFNVTKEVSEIYSVPVNRVVDEGISVTIDGIATPTYQSYSLTPPVSDVSFDTPRFRRLRRTPCFRRMLYPHVSDVSIEPHVSDVSFDTPRFRRLRRTPHPRFPSFVHAQWKKELTPGPKPAIDCPPRSSRERLGDLQ